MIDRVPNVPEAWMNWALTHVSYDLNEKKQGFGNIRKSILFTTYKYMSMCNCMYNLLKDINRLLPSSPKHKLESSIIKSLMLLLVRFIKHVG